MKHNIDTEAILELAEIGNEVKFYLENEYPDVFIENKLINAGFVQSYLDSDLIKNIYIGEVNGYGFIIKKDDENINRYVFKCEENKILTTTRIEKSFLLYTEIQHVFDLIISQHKEECQRLK